MAEGKRPVPFRTRKLSPPAPMVLHSLGCGRVGRRRTSSPKGLVVGHISVCSDHKPLRCVRGGLVSSFEERRGDHDRRQDREGGSGRGRDRDERSAGRERRGTSGMGSHGERNRQSGGEDRQGTGGGRG